MTSPAWERKLMNSEIRIRMACMDDVPALLAIYAPYVENTAVSFEYEAPALADFQGRVAGVLKKFPYLVACRGDEILGYMYAAPYHVRRACDWSVEVSVYLRSDIRRMGLGSRLHNAMEKILTLQGVKNMMVSIATGADDDPHINRDSVVFHERMGYRSVGAFEKCGRKFGRWYNLFWMEKHLGVHGEELAEVIPTGELKEEIEEILKRA